MRILHTVAEYHPAVGGMQEVVRQLSERLAARGHQVTVATAAHRQRTERRINGVEVLGFSVGGSAVHGCRGEVERYRRFLLESDYEIVTNFAAQQWATDLMLPLLERVRGKKVFVPTGFSGLYAPRWGAYFALMPQYLKRYDMNVFLSDSYRDAAFASSHGIANRVLIPNGAGEDEFLRELPLNVRKRLGIPAGSRLIISVGSHTGIKGHAEAIEIFRRAPLVDTAFVIIGNSYWNGCGKGCAAKALLLNRLPSFRRAGKRLVVASLTREETVAAYQQADLFLFPSNVECSPIVLFECLASRTPFLSTEVGNAAEIVEWSGGGALLPTEKDAGGRSRARIAESADLLARLSCDEASLTRMRESGFAAWRSRFTWEGIALQYETLYQGLLRSRGAEKGGQGCSVAR